VGMAVWDSIGGAPSKGDAEKSATISGFGGNSKAITRFANSAGPLANKYKCLTIGINQVRDKIGARFPTLDTPGGHAWKHACSARIWIKPEAKGAESKYFEKVQGQDVQVGYKIQALIMKNSFGAPNKSASWWFYNVPCEHGFGIDTIDELVRLSAVFEVVERRGGWYYHESLPDGKVQGEAKLVATIKEDEEVRNVILDQTRKALSSADDISDVVGTFDPDQLTEIFTDGKPAKIDYSNLMASNAANRDDDE
jgi:recombination protein RecA